MKISDGKRTRKQSDLIEQCGVIDEEENLGKLMSSHAIMEIIKSRGRLIMRE